MTRMLTQAEGLGANGVIGIRISTANIVDGGCEIIAYGTAVRLAPK
jgi:uncharacterized protein YbjQ (UPF0145 family)